MSDLTSLIQRHGRTGLLLDTNILLLLFVGGFSRDFISQYKRTQQFVREDYFTLLKLMEPFPQIVTTPHILTEVYNLSNQIGEPYRTGYFELFAKQIALLQEHYVPSTQLAQNPAFVRFGLTDAAIVHLAQEPYLVLTDDFRLSQYLAKQGVDVINFNHIRTQNW